MLYALLCCTVAACTTTLPDTYGDTSETHDNRQTVYLRDFAKNDLNHVIEHTRSRSLELVQTLMRKLYKRNPMQLRGYTADEAVTGIFGDQQNTAIRAQLNGAFATDAIRLAFAPDYTGDRVLALCFGLATMLDSAYGQTEFFLFDRINPQRLYNSARNIEQAQWLIKTQTDNAGVFFLLGDSLPHEKRNHSFSVLFGKLIAVQDIAAEITAKLTDQQIKNMLLNIGSMLFLPI